MNTQVEQKVLLVINKDKFKNVVKERIILGEEFLQRNISTKIEEDQWWDEFIDWDTYNYEIIKQAFNNPNNIYANEYKRNSGAVGVFYSGSYKTPTLQESIKSDRDEMSYQVRKLKWFYEKIDLLKVSKKVTMNTNQSEKINQLLNLLRKFHKVAKELSFRRQGRNTIIIEDEYDVQDLLNALLNIHFDDIRKEDYSPSIAGANSRLDFVLKKEKIIIEVKMTCSRLGAKELSAELLIDIGRYKEYPNCSDFVIFIYDPRDFIRNKEGLITDLERQSTNEFKVSVIISPKN